MTAELTHAQLQHIEAIDRAASELQIVIRRAMAAYPTAAGDVCRKVVATAHEAKVVVAGAK